jgi:hypothetical protein
MSLNCGTTRIVAIAVPVPKKRVLPITATNTALEMRKLAIL